MSDTPRNPRTLVLCFDGTSNQYDGDNTNVVKFFSLLKKDNFEEQLCYYQAGVGTYFNPGVVSPMLQWFAKIADEAVAWYLDEHVMEGYKFLMQNYCMGDKICLFGFSRGAYTARALAGMLLKVGLLPKDNPQQVPFAYKLYKRTDKEGIQLSAGFKETFCQSVTVEFIGVWETVASVGVVMGRTLPFTASNQDVKTFRHALSLDEHRAKFRPNLFHRPDPNEQNAELDPEHGSPVISHTETVKQSLLSSKRFKFPRRFSFGRKKGKRSQKDKQSNGSDDALNDKSSKAEGKSNGMSNGPVQMQITTEGGLVPGEPIEHAQYETDVLEVWFSGCHSDVGGGAVSDSTQLSLSDITLRWMVREVVCSQCGVQFDDDALERMSIPSETFPPGTSTSAGEAELELDAKDAIQPLHDELKLDVLWWLLEIIPLSYTWQDAKGIWHKTWSINLGRGRTIPDPEPKFHVTVKERVNDVALKYKPKAVWKAGTETYVQ